MTRTSAFRHWLARAVLVLLTGLAGQQGVLAQINQYLPFDMPSAATLRASPKKVFAHYFTPFPLRIGNGSTDATSDYYTLQYLIPSGESGVHSNYGGYLRERPLPVPTTTDPNFAATDMQTEVSRAIAIGLDGFTVDLLLGTVNSNRVGLLLNAANTVDPGFKIVLMPDMDSLTDSNTLTEVITTWAAYPACYHLADGRLVVAPYDAQRQTASWWAGWLAKMSNSYNIKIAFVPVFQGWQTYAAAYAPISYGFSDWGDRSADVNLAPGWTNAASLAHGYVSVWMHPVSAQDERPKDEVYSEAINSANFRYTWEHGAIGKADWVQIPTWNDYSECSEICPSTGIQYAFYDLTAYYTCWFKNNTPPPIVRDCIYYFHRQQNTSTLPTIQTTANLFKIQSSQTNANLIEAYVFLTADATLQVEINGVKTQYLVRAPRAIVDVPLQQGQPTFSLIRNSKTVTSVQTLFIISNTIPYQDMLYHAGSSLRPPITQVPNAYWPRNLILPPPAPAGLSAPGNGALNWTAVSGATSYNVKRSTTNGGPYTTLGNLAQTNFMDTGLTNGMTYYYVVSAVNAGGESANSGQVNASTSQNGMAFGAASAIAGDSDISTVGTFLCAYNLSGTNATVNGVTFTGSASTTALGTNIILAGFDAGNFNGFASGLVTSLSANYITILTGGDYTVGATPATMTLTNLTVGHSYVVQLWADDSRAIGAGRTLSATGFIAGDNSVTLSYNTGSGNGGLGQYTAASFKATAPSQTLILAGSASTQLNAIQVRDISSPGQTSGQVTGVAKISAGVKMSFTGIPSGSYTVERAEDVRFTVNLTAMITTNASGSGMFDWTDSAPLTPTVFYRLRYNNP